MHKLFVLILSLMSIEAFPIEQDDLYYSPGVQVGYGFGEGIFVGGQLTVGYYPEPLDFSKVIPGISLGVRKYFGTDAKFMGYGDLQLGVLIGLGGVGLGYVAIKTNDSITWNSGYRLKLWLGIIGLITYDYYKVPFKGANHNVGLIGVRPFGKNVYYAT